MPGDIPPTFDEASMRWDRAWTTSSPGAAPDFDAINEFLQQMTAPEAEHSLEAKSGVDQPWDAFDPFLLPHTAVLRLDGLSAPSLTPSMEPDSSSSSRPARSNRSYDPFSPPAYATPDTMDPFLSDVAQSPWDLEQLLSLPQASFGTSDGLGSYLASGSSSLPSGLATPRFVTDDERWDAVLRKDPAADGYFVFVVTSTKCICRANCPSRRPLRQNVRFFDAVADAEAAGAGYRPCKRCKPKAAREPTAQRQDEAVDAAQEMIRSAVREGRKVPPLEELAKRGGMSVFHFHRIFKAKTGSTPKKWAAEAA